MTKDTLLKALEDEMKNPPESVMLGTYLRTMKHVIALVHEHLGEDTLMSSQEMNTLEWLKTKHPEVFKEQRHLDEGTQARAYWHLGRWATLKDIRTHSPPPPHGKE